MSYVDLLFDAVKTLAASPQEQLRILGAHEGQEDVPLTDELAEDFDLVALSADHHVDLGIISTQMRDSLLEILEVFDAMTRQHNQDLWTYRALCESDYWHSIREKANALLPERTRLKSEQDGSNDV